MPSFKQRLTKKDLKHVWREGQNPPKFIPKKSLQQAHKQLEAA
jgi:hypothetical protein